MRGLVGAVTMDTNRNLGNRNPNERNVGDKIEEKWDVFRSKVRSKWNDLTDNDLDQYKGKRRDELVGHIGERTGQDRSVIERDVDSLARDTGYRFQ